MQNDLLAEFQERISTLPTRNRCALDILTKFHLTCGRVCRGVVKASTACGCVEISGEKRPPSFEQSEGDSQIQGIICGDCRSVITQEIGEHVFYLASLCNALGIRLDDVVSRELSSINATAHYSLR